MRKFAALLLALTVFLCGCGQTEQTDTQSQETTQQNISQSKTVGICLPEGESATALSALLEKNGYSVQTLSAPNDAALQASQIEKLVEDKASCIVVKAVDSFALTEALEKAKNAAIPVVAYERLLMHTDAVACYVGIDNEAAGVMAANAIVNAKKLDTAAEEKRVHTVEFYMGSPEDSSALAFYNGIMKVLAPYLDSGVLVSNTGRRAFEDTCVQNGSQETAKANCLRDLTGFYPESAPEILCTGADAIAAGCGQALEETGIATPENWPYITGQGATLAGVRQLVSGRIRITLYKDPAALAADCGAVVEMLLEEGLLQGYQGTANNGVKDVPAYLSGSVAVDKENYQKVLVQTGIFTEAELAE